MTGFLSRYGLIADPFAPQQYQMPRRSMMQPVERLLPPDLRMPQMRESQEERQPSLGDLVAMGSRIFGDDTSFEDILRDADRARRSIPELPQSPPEVIRNTSIPYDAQAVYRPSRTAMSPTEGPDTGDVNPNAGAPRGYFTRLQGPESGGDAGIRNPVTGAGGLYQFLPSTWQGIMREAPHLGLTETGFYDKSPEGRAQQERAIRHYTDQSLRALANAGRTQPTMGELYALHFLGQQGGMTLLQGLDRPVAETVSPAAVKSNPWLKSYLDKPGRALLRRFDEMMG